MKKVLVCQSGARHRYLIPRIMYDAGMLSCLYTGACLYSPLGRIANIIRHMGCRNQNINRFANRNPMLPKQYVKSTDGLLLRQLMNRDTDAYSKVHAIYHGLSNHFKRWGIRECDIIYNMYFENIDFLRYAKEKGKTIVIDIYENPTAFKNIITEISSIPEYKRYQSIREQYEAENRLRETYMNEALGLADYYTIPSAFVLNSIKGYENFDANKVRMLPYPSSITKKQNRHSPQKHKIIWVGNAPVRKGLIYCAKAATILKRKFPDLNFEIIGVTNNDLMKDATFKDLNFIGTLNKEQLIAEYESAEAYVFPTLYEGLAGTIIEAACCGCPIITTENAGVEKGVFPALYIPVRDVDAIVTAVEKIFTSPDLQRQLSEDVFQFANKQYSPSTYKENLISLFSELPTL